MVLQKLVPVLPTLASSVLPPSHSAPASPCQEHRKEQPFENPQKLENYKASFGLHSSSVF
jgi:hypothetical protein